MRKLRMKSMIFLLSICLIFVPVASAFGAETENGSSNQRVAEVMELLEQYHISGISSEELSERVIDFMLDSLGDPYTTFMDEQEYIEFQNSIQQNYVGIGIRLGHDAQGYYVVETFPGSPAEQAGVFAGDYITAVAGESVEGWEQSTLIEQITGPEDTEVQVTFQRIDEILNLEIIRQSIQIPVVSSKWFEGDRLGYIQLLTFTDQAAEAFEKALSGFTEQNLQGLVIDLRGNPGGYLHIAERIAKQFIKQGPLLYTVDQDQTEQVRTIRDGSSIDVPIVILVDEGSASASEIFAGALQDYELATLVGQQTYGKGSVQHLITLSDGSVLKVTSEQYLTAKKNKVDQVGLTPDHLIYGYTPQLIAGFQALQPGKLELIVGNKEMTMNGVSFAHSFTYLNRDGKIYIPSRVLSAMIDSEIQWNAEKRLVEFHTGQQLVEFSPAEPYIQNINGSTYIEAGHFQQVFPQFNGQEIEQKLVLTVQ